MKTINNLILIICIFLLVNCSNEKVGPDDDEYWQGIHLLGFNTDKELSNVGKHIPEFKQQGINIVILEVDYHFKFESHPELRQTDSCITKEGAYRFSEICKKNDIRLILQFQCVGHQSWAKKTYKLLTVYPHLDLTPGAFPGNDSLYCREWDVNNPEVYEIVFALMDELIDAFDVDGMHVGMDEVFLLNSEYAPSTKGQDPAKLYAKAVNDLYSYIVKKRGIEMFMWGDRLIDGEIYKYGEWEASMNGTAPAIDMIPKDIIICDWHYEPMEEYPSIPMFIEKGFRVWPASWHKVDASQKLIEYCLGIDNKKMLGHLYTNWGGRIEKLVKYPPMLNGKKFFQNGK